MKIITWNVNGIRSLKNSVNKILKELDSDVTCFQETKISRNQLPENIALIDGYSSYFSYPRKQSGYSGVATYCKDKFVPEEAEEGLSGVLRGKRDDSLINNIGGLENSIFDLTDLDSEGRVIVTYHLIMYEDEIKRLVIINVYCPCVDPEKPERHLYKMQFCQLLEAKTKKLIEDGCFVVIVGDINIACSVIDHCDPGDENEFNSSEARRWLNSFLSPKVGSFNDDVCMVDAFRCLYPNKAKAYTCWNTKTGARLTNYGTRIDYVLISSNLVPLLLECDIMADYEGSDHCPVFADLKCDAVCDNNVHLPAICTRLWPEFSGKQQTLQSFLKKTQALADNLTNVAESNVEPTKNKVKRKSKQKSITNFFKLPETMQKTDSNNMGAHGDVCVIGEPSTGTGECINSSQSSTDSNVSLADESVISSAKSQVSEWKSVLRGPPKPPPCPGHSKPCVLRTVKKKGPNFGRQFFMCSQPVGHTSNPDANCNYFKWVSAAKINTLK